jgi:[ribosomal protein S18]-alanine N-acetyltransferase
MLQQAIAREASWTSLEVRVSNTSAIKLYEKYRYETMRLKSSYYRDNGEDAFWMVAKPLDQSYRTMLITYREQLRQKIEWTTEFPQEISL